MSRFVNRYESMFEKDDPAMTASPVYFASAGYRQFY